MTRQINQEGLDKIKGWEALILYSYDDFDTKKIKTFIKPGDHVAGTLTIGYGHTGRDVKPGMTITQAQAETLLQEDLDPAETSVTVNVKVPLSDNQFAALVSFVFNVGITAFKSSTLLKKLNAGDYSAVPTELMKWTKSKGQQMQGLVNRRSAEAGLWAKGEYVQSAGSPVDKRTPLIFTPQNIATATTLVTGGGAQLAVGDGPFQYALAAIAVIGALVAAYYFIEKRTSN